MFGSSWNILAGAILERKGKNILCGVAESYVRKIF
jgi:hypothetical protein